MWTDNETDIDLIGFSAHADLIRNVVVDPDLLPVVLGLFGDWGGGKSSVMRMIQQRLAVDEYKDVACLYFNGWLFEGYQDAKTALLTSILKQLVEHKRFGPKIKNKALSLLKRVKWMEVLKLGIKHVAVPLVAGALTGGLGTLATSAAMAAHSLLPSGETNKPKANGDEKRGMESEWLSLIDLDPEKADVAELHKFRHDFQEMIDATALSTLVILIDDLDRCLPERIIDTLEAIKLFIAVPKTAFVIGADPRIVRHAIALRYVAPRMIDTAPEQEPYDLTQDYLEKLIQVPYYLPRLSPTEIETYINLLACSTALPDDQYAAVRAGWILQREKNVHASFREADIEATLNGQQAPTKLRERLAWTQAVSEALSEGLKGNPRQIKRMLNAMLLRERLAQAAKIPIRGQVLAKLMVLEYTHPQRFRELNDWQTAGKGFPEQVVQMEKAVISGDVTDGFPRDWNKPNLLRWLQMKPPLAEVDLRDYFWLARDRINSTSATVSMVSPVVRRILESLLATDPGPQSVAAKEAATLDDRDREELIDVLAQHISKRPGQGAIDALMKICDEKVTGATEELLKVAGELPNSRLPPHVAYRLEGLLADPEYADRSKELLQKLSDKGDTPIGKLAKKILAKQGKKN